MLNPGTFGFTESNGCSFAFDLSGTLYATGYGPDGRPDFGTLTVTGRLTKLSASPFGWNAGSLATGVTPFTTPIKPTTAPGTLAR